MIEELLKRKTIHDFLTRYPTNRWKEVISDVFEIGVLNLRNSFNTYEFSQKEFYNILLDLKNYQPDIRTTRRPFEGYIDRGTYYRQEPINYDERQKRDEKSIKRLSTAKCEVFIPDMDEVKRNIRKNRPRYEYYPTPEDIYDQNIELHHKIKNAETKLYDKGPTPKQHREEYRRQRIEEKNRQRALDEANSRVKDKEKTNYYDKIDNEENEEENEEEEGNEEDEEDEQQ